MRVTMAQERLITPVTRKGIGPRPSFCGRGWGAGQPASSVASREPPDNGHSSLGDLPQRSLSLSSAKQIRQTHVILSPS